MAFHSARFINDLRPQPKTASAEVWTFNLAKKKFSPFLTFDEFVNHLVWVTDEGEVMERPSYTKLATKYARAIYTYKWY